MTENTDIKYTNNTDKNNSGKTFYAILNYGCQMNESDAEHYAGQLEELGYSRTEDLVQADVILVNTCCIRESAELKILGKIGELKRVKARHPGQIICVAGCMAQKDGEALVKKYPQIDLLLGTSYVNSFKNVLQAYLEERKKGVFTSLEVQSSEFEGHRVRESGFSAWIPIMYGCNNFCTYCIVPYVRGRERSRSIENILAEVRSAVAAGYTEITLLGQNVDSYGKDFLRNHEEEKLRSVSSAVGDGFTEALRVEPFAALLKAVDQVPGVERVHFMTSHPRDMSEEVIRTVAEGTHLCEHFHVALQSGSSRILKAMNRGYTRERFLELVKMIRIYIPLASITTDIIVGFPGETEEDFAETCSLVEEVGFDSAFTFIYSKRSGTPAARMQDQVPDDVKHARLQKLMDIQNRQSLCINRKLVGQTIEVMAEGPTEKHPKTWSGRTRDNKLVLWKQDFPIRPGQLVQIKIESAQTWLVKGTRVN
ncbi:MAG: tRNA (N6-isopentenyl adenosine(37)-C2)-methylthiotransferase MiaB [Acidaminococcaceae bacterium]|nr:tRNA (N6-isopentenyl adenosine(37)-C2)-methylthiotransferase MiaB [Acidaminococcaceae bacterium]